MKTALIQLDIQRRDAPANIAAAQAAILRHPEADLYILPEMWATGFDMQPTAQTFAAAEEGRLWMEATSRQHDCAILGSLPVHSNGQAFNRCFLYVHGQCRLQYDKHHLFSYGGEDQHYQPGSDSTTCLVGDLRLRPLVCYDLRFPVFSRCRNDYDVLVYVANWPQSRIQAWSALLCARAIENQCYVIGVNRTGADGRLTYNGQSAVYGPDGAELLRLDEQAGSASLDLSIEKVSEVRTRFPFLRDADAFRLL